MIEFTTQRTAMIAPIKPNNMPSIKNGQRIKPLVAPTYFIIAISLRRANTVNRIVLEIINNVAAAKKSNQYNTTNTNNLSNAEELFYNILTIMCTFYTLEGRS